MQKSISSIALVLSVCVSPVFANDDDHWDNQFGAPGADGVVYGLCCGGTNLYLTGNFTSAGESGCIGIAKWSGSSWSGFGSGFAWEPLPVGLAVATRGEEVFVGGGFITNISGVAVRNLARWNGSTWSDMGGGVNGYVYSLLANSSNVYAAGIFSTISGISATNIARWNGTNWFPLGTGLFGATNGLISPVALTMAFDSNGDLIVGGNFRFAGGVDVNNVARWDGSQWHALGNGVFNGGSAQAVSAVASLGPNVYVAGLFKSASGVNATNIARWDGSQWHAMGGGPFGTNYALAIVGTTIYTGGHFTNISGVAARNVARWNGSAWEALAPGTAGEVSTRIYGLATDGTILYAAGDFTRAGNAGALAVAKWDGVQWSALTGPKSQGTWLTGAAIAADGNDIYVGGSGLLIAGGLKPNGIARWNGSAWDNMGGGIAGGSATVGAILPNSGLVYVGGNFTSAGGVPAKNIAYWDGFNWNAMASGLNNNVNALCFHNGQLFAGGAFTARGDGTGNLPGIARWDGFDWVDVPVISSWRINNVINALVSDGVNLYVGGNYFIGWFEPFPPFNGANVDNIGFWDGSNWWPMGNGLTNTVNSLAFLGPDLYAGGTFTVSGLSQVRRLAKWNGSSWSEVGGGFSSGNVSGLAASGSILYVGGSFTNAIGQSGTNRILKWTGSQWQTPGSGVTRISPSSSTVGKIAVSGNDVYLIGSFTYAGGRPSAAFARWNETMAFVPPVIRLLNAGLNGSGQFHFDISGLSSGTFTVQAAEYLTNWSDIFSDSFPNTNFTDATPPTGPRRFYRVKTP